MRPSWRTAFALIATIMVVASVVAVIWLIHSSRHPVDTATVYAGYLAAVAIAITLMMAVGAWWWKGRQRAAARVSTPEQTASAADRLANLMTARWRQEATARRIVTPAPATIRWRWASEEVAAPRAEVTTPPAPGTGPPHLPDLEEPGELLESGVVARLHDEVYARLPHGRLVLLGGPGAGKTGAMILLLLAGLDRRASLGGEQRTKVPVPVWLTLGGWDPVNTSLQKWAVDTMNRDHPALRAADYGPDAAGELLRAGRVALFLDGLDEMPEGLRARALKRVDEEARGLRVVVTSRPEEYRGAVQSGGLGNTAVIELRPVRANAAAAYLQHGQTGLSRHRWEQVGAYLKRSPNSVAARALDNPLTLSLARDSYTTQDPAVLTDPGRFPTEDAVREHLIDQLLITAYPDEHQRAQVTRWLAWIAHQMGTSRDLPWWEISTWIPQWKLHIARGLAIGLAVGATVSVRRQPSGRAGSGTRAWARGCDHSRACGRGRGRLCRRTRRRAQAPAPHTHPALAAHAPACLDPPGGTGHRARGRARGRARRRARGRICVRVHGPSRLGVHSRLRGGVRIRTCSRASLRVSWPVGDPDRRFALGQRGRHLPRRPPHQRDRGADGRAGRRPCGRPRSWP